MRLDPTAKPASTVVVAATRKDLGSGCRLFEGRYYSSFGPDGSLAYVSSDGTIQRYWFADKKRVQIDNPLVGVTPTAVCFDFAGELIASACTYDEPQGAWHVRIAKVHNTKGGDWHADLLVPADGTKRPKGKRYDFLLGDEGRKVLLWTWLPHSLLYEVGSPDPPRSFRCAISLSPDGRRVADVPIAKNSLKLLDGIVLRDSRSGRELPKFGSLGWCQIRVAPGIWQRRLDMDSPPVQDRGILAAISNDWTRAAAMIINSSQRYSWTIPSPVGGEGDE